MHTKSNHFLGDWFGVLAIAAGCTVCHLYLTLRDLGGWDNRGIGNTLHGYRTSALYNYKVRYAVVRD
jgi:hypothetical protein